MKLKLMMLCSTLLLIGCDKREMAQLLGQHREWYVGLEQGTIQEVQMKYHENLIEEVRIECDYYVSLENGIQLKFNKSHHAKENTCRYQVGDGVNVEVYEDDFGVKRYEIVLGVREE